MMNMMWLIDISFLKDNIRSLIWNNSWSSQHRLCLICLGVDWMINYCHCWLWLMIRCSSNRYRSNTFSFMNRFYYYSIWWVWNMNYRSRNVINITWWWWRKCLCEYTRRWYKGILLDWIEIRICMVLNILFVHGLSI